MIESDLFTNLYFTFIYVIELIQLTKTSRDIGAGKREIKPPQFAGWSANWYNYFRKSFGNAC